MTKTTRLPDNITEFSNMNKSLREVVVQRFPDVGEVYVMDEETVHMVYDAGFAMALAYLTEQKREGWGLDETFADLVGHIQNSKREA